MAMTERINNVDELRAWKDEIPFHYEYTAGVAGEKFLRGLERGKIIVSRCKKCGKSFIPPKAYCVDDFVMVSDYPEVGLKGKVLALTESHVDFSGKRLDKPTTFVFVGFPGVAGGILHRAAEDGLKLGGTVAPVFLKREERRGSLADIVGFAKA